MLNKPIAEILTPPLAAAASHKDHLRGKSLSTEGFTTTKFCELIVRDGSMLSKGDALTICEYIMAMKRS
jgi:hypothetical protein